MLDYNHNEIEKKWQDYWYDNKTFATKFDESKEKFYALVEFPYPSGEGLHVGHPRPYTALDVVARKRRMEGYNVLFPMGWDAFGLPTENFAIKHKIHPRIVTERNIANFKKQLKSIGFSFDWDREINTTDPKYYRWTQWIFLKLFEKGLAYKKEMPVNWCPSCKIGLANEEVVAGNCERCGHIVERRVISQWMLKITEYADRLIDDLELVDYPHKVKASQINWIGRSYGAEIEFPIVNEKSSLKVFTTRPDTIFGASYMVIAPEHPLLDELKDKIKNYDAVCDYRHEASHKSEFERTELSLEKTGIMLEGIKALNPVSKKEIPIWISDYVLITYGTGAIMAVPAHDERDYEFAKKFDMPIIEVIKGGDIEKEAYTDTNEGILINSDFLNGLNVKDAIAKMNEYLVKNNLGEKKVNYRLRDWLFSRQRYWGEPIPLVDCEDCGWVALSEEDLPLLLPEVENYEPTDDGKSPLANIKDWVETTCPKCGKAAKRETDTMPQWAGSSWYFLRYIDPNNDEEFANRKKLDYFMPVDWYNGGMEHTTLHLLYSRFWYKFLYDLGVVPGKEPYMKRTSHGMILGENNEKMSKSRGNVVNPDDIVHEYGADTLRTYEMFIGDFEKSVSWSENGVKGCKRFLDRVWNLQTMIKDSDEYSKDMETEFHQTIKKVSNDYENLKYNTAIAALMSLLNSIQAKKEITKGELRTFLKLLNPVAPHITEEIWIANNLGGYLHEQNWPEYIEDKTIEDIVEIPVQFNGKLRFKIEAPRTASEEEIKKLVIEHSDYEKALGDKKVIKEIYVPLKIYNLVIK
ncbi:MAG: leucine--tRNA ligase [Tissierellia bacterium]|nr:leucine--tRNA ligase [Tissierellia bacterium]